MLPLVFPHQLHNQHAQQHRREHHSQQKQPKARLLYFQKKAYQSSQPYQANQAAQLASRKQQISPARQRQARPAGGNVTNNRSVTTNVSQVTINTQATDVPGIARDFSGELQNQVAQADGANGV